MNFYCIQSTDTFTAGKVYGGLFDGQDYIITNDRGIAEIFTVEPDDDGDSYKTWFTTENPNYKSFGDMTQKELQEVKNDLLRSLKSTINPSQAVNLTNNGVRFTGGRLQAEYNAHTGSLYVHSTGGKRYAGGQLSVAQLSHAQDVLRRFYAKHVGGFNLD